MTRSIGLALSIASVVLAAAACGDDGNDVDPRVIPGGGIGDGAIDGEVNVHAIDEDTDEPIAGATVHVGDVEGTTDDAGLFVAADVSGAQTITITAAGYSAATWVGANGANVTVPMTPDEPVEPADVPQGTVSGTIDGFTDIPVPKGHAIIAFVGYSQTGELGGAENEIGTDGETNRCTNLGGPNPTCEWTIASRTGQVMIYAFIGDVDLATQAITVNGFAFTGGIEVGDGEDVTDVTLTQVSSSDLLVPDIALPDGPNGTDNVQALIRVQVGDDGSLPLPVTGDIIVPVPETTVFGDASYEVIGVASSETDPNAQSIILERGITSLDGHAIGELLFLPDGLSADGANFEINEVPGAALHTFEISEVDGTQAWGVAFFDGSTSLTLPPGVTLPDGALVMTATAIDGELDLSDFELDGIEDLFDRISSSGLDFTN